MLNNIQLVGRCGGDPEIRFFESGAVNCKFTLAVNQNKRDAKPDWFNIELWGRNAEVAAQYVKKGSLLGISGSLEIERWSDRATGESREKPVVKATVLNLLGSKAENNDLGN
jgi:single-strand DNA-binding protein